MANLNLIDMGRRPTPQIRYHPSGVKQIDELPRKRKPKRNFDFLLDADSIKKGDRPWEF